MKSLQTCFSGLIVLILLAGCAQAIGQPTPTSQPQAINTFIATVTPTASITTTPTQTVTPIPPPTRRATPTDLANTTVTATITPLASFTLKPTSKFTRTVTATVTGTNTLYVRPPGGGGGTTWTRTPIPFKCTIVSSYPEYMQKFKPRTDFVAEWRIVNTGVNMWHKDDILFGFAGGTKMHNESRGDKILDYTLYVRDSMKVVIHMRPPKEPGIYTTSWGLRKTNKKEFFCTLTVTIEVVSK